MDLSIICVNWNSSDYMELCLKSIQRYASGISYEVIVVDNASKEEDFENLKTVCGGGRILRSEKNLGFAGANNLGFKNSVGEYVLFLNPDTEVVGSAIQTMLGEIKSLPDAGIVGCKLLNSDGSVQLSSIQKLPTILNQVLDAEYLLVRWPRCPIWSVASLFSDKVDPVKVDVISGACMLLRRNVFARVGMFSEDYFMYAEDIDLNFKVKQASFSNYYVGGAEIVHHGGGSSSRQSVSEWKTVMKYSAMRRYFRKTRGRVYEFVYRAAMGCTAAARLIILGLAYPLGNLLGKRGSLRIAISKWTTILRWAMGQQILSAPGR